MMQEIIAILFVEGLTALFVMLFTFPMLGSYAGRALYFSLLAGANLVLMDCKIEFGVFIAPSLASTGYFLFQEVSERKKKID